MSTLNKLAKRHIEQLTKAIDESKKAAEAHTAKAEEFRQQVMTLETELKSWEDAVAAD